MSTLAELFHDQQSHLDQLEALLLTEQAELTAPSIDGNLLVELSSQKHSHINALDELEVLRLKTQQKLGYSEDLKGTMKAAQDAGCGETWTKLLDAAHHVTHLNNVNGSLIDHQLIHNQKALNTLAEISGRQGYDSDGRASLPNSNLNSFA